MFGMKKKKEMKTEQKVTFPIKRVITIEVIHEDECHTKMNLTSNNITQDLVIAYLTRALVQISRSSEAQVIDMSRPDEKPDYLG